MPIATSSRIARRSPRCATAPASTRTPTRGRASPSSCRRCIRATSAHSARRVLTRARRRGSSTLCGVARESGVALTLDAEESERLELSLELLEIACRDTRLEGWNGFGLAVQAYQKRAPAVLELAGEPGAARRDASSTCASSRARTGTARSSARRSAGYRATRCSRARPTPTCPTSPARGRCSSRPNGLYPQFATHNAHTVAAIWHLARRHQRAFEFQRLHGMGEELYAEVIRADGLGVPCRVYAPVGEHEDLLPYLVRRLLENGANTSFVNRLVNENEPIGSIVADPARAVESLRDQGTSAHPAARSDLRSRTHQLAGRSAGGRHGAARDRRAHGQGLAARVGRRADGRWTGAGGADDSNPQPCEPRRRRRHRRVRRRRNRSTRRSTRRRTAQPGWDATPAAERAAMLERAADLYEANLPELLAMCVREAGKTIPDSVAEIREAVDFLRYYAARARAEFGDGQRLPGTDRREQRAHAARARRVRLYQPVELPARDLHRPGRCGTGGRQHGASPSPRSRRRSSRRKACGCCTRRESRTMCCSSCRAMARSSVRAPSRIRASRASRSRARPRRRG